jgi:hypothetical protein
MLQSGMEQLSRFLFFVFLGGRGLCGFFLPKKPQRLENVIIWGSLRTWYGRLLAKGHLAAARF